MTTDTILVVISGVVVQVIIAAYTFGKLSNEVVNLRKWLGSTSEKVEDHETRLSWLEGAEGRPRG